MALQIFGSKSSGGASALASLTDVDLTGGTAGQVLTKRASDGKYAPAAVGKFDAARQLYNVSADSLRKWRAAKAKALAGLETGEVVLFGDSISLGNPGATPGTTDIMTQLQTRLAGAGYPSAGTSYYHVGDTVHWAVTGSVSRNNTGYSTMSVSSTATFTPGQNVGSFDLVYLQFPSAGSFTYQVDAGSATTVNASGTASNVRIRVDAGGVGTHTLKITALSGNTFMVKAAGNTAPATSASGIRLSTNAAGGNKISDIYNTIDATSRLPAGISGGAKLALIMMETNDFVAQTALATYSTQFSTAITYLQGQGIDVVLLTTPPPGTAPGAIPLASYTAALYTLADTYGCPVLDIGARWKDYTTTNALGLYSDTLHGNPTGYADIGAAILPLLAA